MRRLVLIAAGLTLALMLVGGTHSLERLGAHIQTQWGMH